MDSNLQIYYETAKKLKLPVTFFKSINCLQIKFGKKRYYFKKNLTPINNGSSSLMTIHRHALLLILSNCGYPVPNFITLGRGSNWQEYLPHQILNLKFPVAIKPVPETYDEEIYDIKTFAQLQENLNQTFIKHTLVQVEEFHQNFKEYRIILLKNRVLSVVEEVNGKALALGKKIHPDNIKHLCQAAHKIGLDLVEFTIYCEDIMLSFIPKKWLIHDMRIDPNLKIHEFPDGGKKMYVSQKILQQLIKSHPLSYALHRLRLLVK